MPTPGVYRRQGGGFYALGQGTTVFTPDTTAPTAPSNFRLVSRTTTSLQVAWDASFDLVGVDRYVIEPGDDPVTLAPTQLVYTKTGLTPGTSYTFFVTAFDGADNPSTPASQIFTTQAGVTPPTTPAFAGHIPFQVQLGMVAPADGTNTFIPTYTNALNIINKPLRERRLFYQPGEDVTTARMDSFANLCDQRNQLLVGSFKMRADTDQELYVDRILDPYLTIMRNHAIARRSVNGGNGKPYLWSFWHEPNTDENKGSITSGQTPLQWHTAWGKMQQYCSDFLAGKTRSNSTASSTALPYNAANDVRDILTWYSIQNGFLWSSNASDIADANASYSQALIDTFRINNSVLCIDVYDTQSVDATGDPASIAPSARRLSKQILAFQTYALSKNCGYLGIGETSTMDKAELRNCWETFWKGRRDKWVFVNWYNTGSGSAYEWRIIPDSFAVAAPGGGWPLTSYAMGNNREIGGTVWTEQVLNEFRAIIDESSNPAIMTPM